MDCKVTFKYDGNNKELKILNTYIKEIKYNINMPKINGKNKTTKGNKIEIIFMKIKKIILFIIFNVSLIILVNSNKYNNFDNLFYGKYKIIDVVKTFGTLNLFEREEEANEYKEYLKFDLNYDNDKLINSIIEINEEFIKVDDNIILKNPEYEISIIPTSKIEEFYYKKKPYDVNSIINENEPYFIYVNIVNLDILNSGKYYYLSSFYLKDNSIILDADGEFLTRYKALKLENKKSNINKNNYIKFDKYVTQLFYGIWSLNYNDNFYKIDINEDVLDIPYKVKVLKPSNLNNKQKKMLKDISANSIFGIEFESGSLYKSKIKNIYILDEDKLIIDIDNNYYKLDRVGSVKEFEYYNGI